MNNGQSVNPHPPAAILVFDGVVEKHAKKRVNHIGKLLLFSVLWMDVRHGYEPLLPNRHLQDRPPVLAVVIAKQRHVGQEQLLDLKQLLVLFRLANQRSDNFQNHYTKKSKT